MLGLVMGGLQALGGAVQAISGSRQAKRAERALENLQTPTTTNDAAINNYYSQANANPYDTAFYKQQQQQANRGFASGLAGAQDRRGGLAAIGGLLRGRNDALLRAGVSAEQQQRQMFGQATRMKASDNQRVWEINKMMPYQKQFGLLNQKAAGGNMKANAGWSNIFGGAQTAAMAGGAGGGGFLGGLFGGGKQAGGDGGASARYQQPTVGVDNSQMQYSSPSQIFG
jgi:hypothetical protein